MMKRICLAAVILATSLPAWAGWQNTQWGMTPDEVIAAGNGKITRDNVQNLQRNGYQGYDALAVQPYSVGEIVFAADYLFKNNKLEMIILTPQDKQKAIGLERIMRDTYGQPLSDNSSKVMNCANTSITWRDEKLSNNVMYSSLVCPGNQIPPVFNIMYRPLLEPGKSGL